MAQTTDIAALQRPPATTPLAVNMFTAEGFELAQRIARAYQTANAVPSAFRAVTIKREKQGNDYYDVEVPNPAALGNCIVAIETAQAVGMSITAVMQNANVIEGRLSWSGKFVIAAINASRRFSPLRFRITHKGMIKATYKEKGQWNRELRRYDMIEREIEVENIECVAWAYVMENGRRTDEIVEGVPVSIKMAVEEGWYSKPGSKWQTELKHLMLQYRAGSFFGNIHAPDIVMGMGRTTEEWQDTLDAHTGPDGSISVNLDELRASGAASQATEHARTDAVRGKHADVTDIDSRPAAEAKPYPPSEKAKAEAAQTQQQRSFDITYEQVAQKLRAADSLDVLDVAADLIGEVQDPQEQDDLRHIYGQRKQELADAPTAQPRATRSRRSVAAPE
ncbi:hypothetical protein V8Z80_08320 [Orrella sp. JC864]|uniref:hypothetical protein n=1 Tax=Orrella sp. JC864 TaxID=3120298 RepID=UPI00300BF5F3